MMAYIAWAAKRNLSCFVKLNSAQAEQSSWRQRTLLMFLATTILEQHHLYEWEGTSNKRENKIKYYKLKSLPKSLWIIFKRIFAIFESPGHQMAWDQEGTYVLTGPSVENSAHLWFQGLLCWNRKKKTKMQTLWKKKMIDTSCTLQSFQPSTNKTIS